MPRKKDRKKVKLTPEQRVVRILSRSKCQNDSFLIAVTKSSQECREAFELFDTDGSGEIDEQELKSMQVLHCCMQLILFHKVLHMNFQWPSSSWDLSLATKTLRR